MSQQQEAWQPGSDASGSGASSEGLAAAYGHLSDALKLLRDRQPLLGPEQLAPLRGRLKAMRDSVAFFHARALLGALDPASPPIQVQAQVQPQPGGAVLAQLTAVDDKAAAAGAARSREAAVSVLSEVLREIESAAQRQALLAQVRPELSAREQISLHEAVTSSVPLEALGEEELYDAALAYLWDGYSQRWPHHVYAAQKLLHVIDGRTSLGLDLSIEHNVCALLLGGPAPAALAAPAAPVQDGVSGDVSARGDSTAEEDGPSRPEAALGGTAPAGARRLRLGAPDGAYVIMMDQAPGPPGGGGGDARDGGREGGEPSSSSADDDGAALESWAERWLELSCQPCFEAAGGRGNGGGGGRGLSVRSYLSSPKVVVFNQVLQYASMHRLRDVTDAIAGMSHDALQQLLGLWRSTGWLAGALTLPSVGALFLGRPPAAAATAAAAGGGGGADDAQGGEVARQAARVGAGAQQEQQQRQQGGGAAPAPAAAATAAGVLGAAPTTAHSPQQPAPAADPQALARASDPLLAPPRAAPSSRDSSTSDEDATSSPPRLWVAGPRETIQPRMHARIFDPTATTHDGGAAQRRAAWRWVAWGVGVGAVVGCAAAGTFAAWGGRTVGRAAAPAIAAAAGTAAWRLWCAVGAHAIPMPRDASELELLVRRAHAVSTPSAHDAHGTGLDEPAAVALLGAWHAAVAHPVAADGQHAEATGAARARVLPLLLDGAALRGAQAQAKAQQQQQQQQQRGGSKRGAQQAQQQQQAVGRQSIVAVDILSLEVPVLAAQPT
ncbi:hypothetical protein FOA52_001670 [Chlamydomonas sp. UWO 241]|nr:hypothetical protein FOA52_001670 [Chlamydomonas sp. UWO 241]